MADNRILRPRLTREFLIALPFAAIFVTAFFLETAPHRIVFYVFSLLMIANLWREKAICHSVVRTYSFTLITLYAAFFFLSTLWGEKIFVYESFRTLLDGISIMIFTFSLAVFARNFNWRQETIMLLTGFCLAAAAIYAVQYYIVIGDDIAIRLWGQGRFHNPIHLSILLSLSALLLLSVDFTGTRHSIIFRSLLLLGLVFFIVITQARSSLLALGACVFILTFFYSWRLSMALAGMGLLCLLAAFFLWGGSLGQLYERADTHRFNIWRDAVEGITEKPLIGHGLSTKPEFDLASGHGYKSTHNFVLGHLYFGGITATILIFLIFANGFKQTIFSIKRWGDDVQVVTMGRFTILALTFCVVTSLFNFSHYMVGVHIQWLVFWVPISLAWALETKNMESRHAQTS